MTRTDETKMSWTALGIALGEGIGLTLGLVFSGGASIALGLAFGAGIGVAVNPTARLPAGLKRMVVPCG